MEDSDERSLRRAITPQPGSSREKWSAPSTTTRSPSAASVGAAGRDACRAHHAAVGAVAHGHGGRGPGGRQRRDPPRALRLSWLGNGVPARSHLASRRPGRAHPRPRPSMGGGRSSLDPARRRQARPTAGRRGAGRQRRRRPDLSVAQRHVERRGDLGRVRPRRRGTGADDRLLCTAAPLGSAPRCAHRLVPSSPPSDGCRPGAQRDGGFWTRQCSPAALVVEGSSAVLECSEGEAGWGCFHPVQGHASAARWPASLPGVSDSSPPACLRHLTAVGSSEYRTSGTSYTHAPLLLIA